MNLDDWRRCYSEEVRWCAGVKSSALLEAFARVPRERFLGPPPWQLTSPDVAAGAAGSGYTETRDPRDLYHNVLVALDAPRHVNNGQPSALARWIDALDLKTGDRVIHLGCGVGYYTAILAETVGPGGRVVASEVDPGLAVRAQANLADYKNVVVHAVDGAVLDAGECDAMLINAGVTHPHPRWLEELSEGGRLVLPITAAMPQSPEFGRGAMMKLVAKGGAFSARMVSYVAIFSCTSVRDSALNAVIGKALSTGAMTKIQSLRREGHEPSESCVVHGDGMCLSSAPAE